MRRTVFCKHYRAMSEHKTCKAGVEYASLPKPMGECPCWGERGQPHPQGEKCSKCEMPTEAEQLERDKLIAARLNATGTARKAIVDHLGGPWKKGTPGAADVIDCPVCGKAKGLHFSRSGYNGHIHAQCETKDCVCWME